MLQIETFDGTKNPIDHLNTYKNHMELHRYYYPIRCRAFAITLKGPALAWFNRLLSSSISSFIELSITFISHFIGARTYRKPSYHLLTINQNSQESLGHMFRIQRRVSEGRYSRREVRHHNLHRRARGAVKRSNVLHLKKTLKKAWLRCYPKQRSISMAKKPSYPSKGVLLLKKKRAGATRNGNEALGGRRTGIDP